MNWLKGLLAAAVGGAGSTITVVGGQWAQNFLTGQPTTPLNGGTVGYVALAGAIIGVAGYFTKSPLQPKG